MSGWQDIDAYLASTGFGVLPPQPGQTVRDLGGPSLHAVGRARDYGDALYGQAGCWDIYNRLWPFTQNGVLEELFWDPSGSGWKWGQDIGPIGGHSDHVHAGIAVDAVFPAGAPSPAATLPPLPPPFKEQDIVTSTVGKDGTVYLFFTGTDHAPYVYSLAPGAKDWTTKNLPGTVGEPAKS